MNKTTIIVAGGKGLRMGADCPKQFILLDGLPVLMHTIKAFHDFDAQMQIILVLPKEHLLYWTSLCKEYDFTIAHQVCCGGSTRYQSVKNGLVKAQGDIIAVHDGVRPFVSKYVIKNCFDEAKTHKAVVPVLPLNESLRRIDEDKNSSKAVDRSMYCIVQTPQVFQARFLRKAYQEVKEGDKYTDDASLVQALHVPIHLIDGNRENIKITHPEDIEYTEFLIHKEQEENNKVKAV